MRRKNERWIKKILLFVLCLTAGGSITGCGGNATNSGGIRAADNRAVSASTVSGSAVSGGALQDAGAAGGFRFCTGTNLYYTEAGDKNDKLMQMRCDGTGKKEIKLEEKSFIFYGLAADGLYYEDIERGTICRIPVKKDADGFGVAEPSGKEIFEFKDMNQFLYADDRYFFYLSSEGSLVKYNRTEGKKVAEIKNISHERSVTGSSRGEVVWLPYVTVYRIGERYVALALAEGSAIFVQERDETEWIKAGNFDLQERGDSLSGPAPSFCCQLGEKGIYYVPLLEDDKSAIRVFDGKEDKVFLSNESLLETVKTAKKFDEKSIVDTCVITDLFLCGEDLYVQVQVNWTEEDTYHMEYVMLRQGTDETSLHYEKELTESMHADAMTWKGTWEVTEESAYEDADVGQVILESVTVKDARCIAIAEGKVYMSCYDYKNKKGRLGCYEYESGKFFFVEQADLPYYQLYQTGHEFGFYQEVYHEKAENSYAGFVEVPTADAYLEGDFVPQS